MFERIKAKLYMFRHRNQLAVLHEILWVYTGVFIVWGIYRFLFPMNVWVEETVLKFIVFGLPPLWVVLHKHKGSLEDMGMTTQGLVASLYFGLLFGLWLAIFGNVVSFVNNGSLGLNPNLTVLMFRDLLVLGLMTAFWEQLLFMGYMLPRMVTGLESESQAILAVAFLFALIHIPVQIASGVGMAQILLRFVLIFSLGYGNGILYLRFKNLAAPIFAHLAWGSVIFLFG